MTRITIAVRSEAEKKRVQHILQAHRIPYEETSSSPTQNGQRVAELMQELAEDYSLNEIKDPAAWQREVRQDRKLPFRN